MTRLDSPSRLTVKPGVNVYTGLAVLSFIATAAAFAYALMQYLNNVKA